MEMSQRRQWEVLGPNKEGIWGTAEWQVLGVTKKGNQEQTQF
jgi:hypothetical protein